MKLRIFRKATSATLIALATFSQMFALAGANQYPPHLQSLSKPQASSALFPTGPASVDIQTQAGLRTAMQELKLSADDLAERDRFGYSVSLDGNRALVGSVYDDDNGYNSGSAYVFTFDGKNWVQEAKLIPLDGEASDNFGASVSLWGNRALVGSLFDNDDGSGSGSAYVFTFDGTSWVQETKLTASDASAADGFGWSVSLHGTRALVGAIGDDDNGSASGSAYLFTFDGVNWTQETKLKASDGTESDQFGYSVSIDGSRAIVGAPTANGNDNGFGAAYVFTVEGESWVPEAKLTSGDGAGQFGYSVSLDDTRAMVGATADDTNGSSAGAAFLFIFNGTSWLHEVKLNADDGAEFDQFGHSVSLDGTHALVGAPYNNDNGTRSGSAYLFGFDGTSWSQETKLVAGDGAETDDFGYAVSVSGGNALVGAWLKDEVGTDSGSAYLYFVKSPSPLFSDRFEAEN